MSSDLSSKEIKRAAERWAKKMISSRVTHEEQIELADWLESDPAHKHAFFSSRHQLLKKKTVPTRIVALGLAMAASILVFLVVPYWQSSSGVPPLVYAYAQGENHALSDGSQVELNLDSEIEVTFSEGQRQVTLVRGDAWFKVAPDIGRPFKVTYQGLTVTALGTEFSVKTHRGLQVQVTEHSVRLDMEPIPDVNANDAENGYSIVLNQGQGIQVDNNTWRMQSDSEFNTALAWRNQLMIFDATPLKLALEELSLYLGKEIQLMNPARAKEPVSGRFNTAEPELTLEMICEGLGLRKKELAADRVVLF